MKTEANSINNLSKRIFWGVDPNTINWESHSNFIFERVMRYGTLEDWKIIKKVYGLSRVNKIAMEARNLDDFSLSFLSSVFAIPKEKFRCYTLKQSSQSFWNY
jgi:hypothetical protein